MNKRYKAAMANLDRDNDAKIPAENIIVDRPVLYIAGQGDEIGRPELSMSGAADGKKSGMLPDVQVKVINGTMHWPQVEKPDETFALLEAFFKGV